MKDGGKLRISAGQRRDNTYIKIMDDSLGFTEDEIESIDTGVKPKTVDDVLFSNLRLVMKNAEENNYKFEVVPNEKRGNTFTLII